MKKQYISSKGQVIVLIAISLVVILALVGLALDVGRAYGVKARLNAAVDSAAIAGGKGVKQGANDTQSSQNAQTAAQNAFSANFTEGYLGSTPVTAPNITTSPVHLTDGSWTVSVTAARAVPTYLAKLVGWSTLNVSSTAQATTRTLDMMLVLDNSQSLVMSNSFDPLKAAAANFVSNFQGGAGGDRVGLVTFASGAYVNVPIDKTTTRGFDKTAMVNTINALTPGTTTASAEGMREALYQLDSIPANIRSSLRVIVFFSDGEPNTIAGSFQTSTGAIIQGDLFSGTGNLPTNPITSYYSPTTVKNPNSTNVTLTYLNPYPINTTTGMTYAMDYVYTGYPSASAYSAAGSPSSPPPQTPPLDSLTQRVDMQYYYQPIPLRRTFVTDTSGNILNNSNGACNVNRAARNMVENVANTARTAPATGVTPVTIYTIGLGQLTYPGEITCPNYDFHEGGAHILQNLANATGCDTFNPNQPVGQYVNSPTAAQLNQAFQTISNIILRLSQ
jgi:Flp pilus assembly protein TadG